MGIRNVVLVGFLLFSVSIMATSKMAEEDALKFQVRDVYDPKVASEMIARWAKGERKPNNSATMYGESDLGGFAKIRDELLKISSPEDIDRQILNLERQYKDLPPEAQFFAAQLIMLKPLRGIVWRLRPLFESKNGKFDFFSGNSATHSAAVTMLRMVSHATSVYVPTGQSRALFNYLVTPSVDMKLEDQFRFVSRYQTYLRTEFYNALIVAAARLTPLYRQSRAYVWDNKIFYGTGSFDDDIRRYVGFDEAAVQLTAAAIQKSAHDVMVFCAFDQEQLMNVMGSMAKLYGVNGFASQELGVTSRARSATLKPYRETGFLNLLPFGAKDNKVGKARLQTAYTHLVAAVELSKTGYDILAASPEGNSNVLNPLFFKGNAQPHLQAGVGNLVKIVNGRTDIRSGITGESVTIDIPNFYRNPPDNLMDLLPTGWLSVQNQEDSITNKAGQKLFFRNYKEGSPTTWKTGVWKNLFPSVGGKITVADAFRTVSASYGPSIILGPMSYFIY